MESATGWAVALCWMGFAIVWIVGAFTAKRAAGAGSRRWWYRLAVVGVFLLFLRQSLPLMNIARTSSSLVTAVSADVITFAGLIIAIWSRVVLGVYWSGIVVVKEAHVIVARGPYRLVRHPIYLGVLLMLLGTALWWGRPVGLALFVVALVGFLVKARAEERLLSKHFPVEYGSYKAQVKHALVPWLA